MIATIITVLIGMSHPNPYPPEQKQEVCRQTMLTEEQRHTPIVQSKKRK